MKSLVFPRIFLHCVALGFIVSGLLLSGRPLVRIQPGVPDFLSKALAARAFVFYPFWCFLAAYSMPSRGCRPLFARGWAAAASNACSPRRFSAIERRALDRPRAAGYHDGIAYHFNYGGGNGCAQRIPQAPIFFSANGIGTLLGNIGQHGHGDEGR